MTIYGITSLTAVQADRVLLVTEHEVLDVLDCFGPGEQRQPAQHSGEQQVTES